jgi:prepilin-type N-terminal cleavage/methylation domain-containing protein
MTRRSQLTLPSGRRLETHGFTLLELMVVMMIIAVIAAIAIPGLIRARMSGNEASAIGSMRAIHNSQVTYAQACGGGGFATSLADLATPPNGGGAAFISPDLRANGVVKAGYAVLLVPGAGAAPVRAAASTCNSTLSQSSYHATATPMTIGVSGTRAFATNGSGAVFESYSGAVIPPTLAGSHLLQ